MLLYYNYLVPTPGLEPGRPYGQGILSPLRLPIPPSGHTNKSLTLNKCINYNKYNLKLI